PLLALLTDTCHSLTVPPYISSRSDPTGCRIYMIVTMIFRTPYPQNSPLVPAPGFHSKDSTHYQHYTCFTDSPRVTDPTHFTDYPRFMIQHGLQSIPTFQILPFFLKFTPGCRLEGNRTTTKQITAYTGDSVLLPCSCTDLHTKPQSFRWEKYIWYTFFIWEKISPESEQYKNRFQLVNDQSSGNLSLLISHLTVEDDGDYRCNTESEYRYTRLSVKEAPKRPSPSTTAIQTTAEPDSKQIIISCGAVVVLLLLIVGGVMYWKHRGQRENRWVKDKQDSRRRRSRMI
ncbi:hypothetical protein HF521_008211, partial [Silurus meridionalis]